MLHFLICPNQWKISNYVLDFCRSFSDLITKAKLAITVSYDRAINNNSVNIQTNNSQNYDCESTRHFGALLIVGCSFAWLPFAVEMCVTQLCSLSVCVPRLRFTANRYTLPTETLWPFIATC